jgi:hypothetical protein
MVLSAAVALALAAAEVPTILTPVSYQVAVISRADGSEVATLLAVSSSALDAGRLSREQALQWNGLKSRIAMQYAGADRRGRARLILELLKLESQGPTHIDNSVWVRFPAGETTRAEFVLYPHEGSLWRVTDPSTGQYVAIVKYEDTSGLMRIFDEMFAETTHADVTPKLRTELERVAADSEALVEVDGQREYLAKGQATPAALAEELAGLLANLYGEGRSRILETASIMNSFREGALKADDLEVASDAMSCAAPCDWKVLPLPPVAATLKVHAIVRRRAPLLEAVDEAVAKEFFRDGRWPAPDLDLPFAEQMRKLLSAKD